MPPFRRLSGGRGAFILAVKQQRKQAKACFQKTTPAAPKGASRPGAGRGSGGPLPLQKALNDLLAGNCSDRRLMDQSRVYAAGKKLRRGVHRALSHQDRVAFRMP